MAQLVKILFYLLLFAFAGCSASKKHPSYTIALDPSWQSIQAHGQEAQLTSFSIAILTRVAKEANIELSVVQIGSTQLLFGLDHKSYDGILNSMTPRRFHQDRYEFSDPFLMTGPILVVPKMGDVPLKFSLVGKEVGVIYRSESTILLQKYPGIILRPYTAPSLLFEALQKDHLDAIALEILLAQKFVQNLYANQMMLLPPTLDNEGLRLICLPKNDKLIKAFNKGLDELRKNGDYETLLKRWGFFPDGTQPSQASS